MHYDNFEDFLKKAIEEETKEPVDVHGDTDGDEVAEQMMALLEGTSLIKLAKAALDKKKTLIKSLQEYLNNLDTTDEAMYYAKASAKILSIAKEMRILDVIISTASMTGKARMTKKGMDDILNIIVGVNKLI